MKKRTKLALVGTAAGAAGGAAGVHVGKHVYDNPGSVPHTFGMGKKVGDHLQGWQSTRGGTHGADNERVDLATTYGLGAGLLTAAAAYLAGRGAMWIANKVKKGTDRSKAEKQMAIARKRLQSDKAFASRARAHMREQFELKESKKDIEKSKQQFKRFNLGYFGALGGAGGLVHGALKVDNISKNRVKDTINAFKPSNGQPSDEHIANMRKISNHYVNGRVGTTPDLTSSGEKAYHIGSNTLLGIAAGVLLGYGLTWVLNRFKFVERSQATKAVEHARQKLKTDPKFAAKARVKAQKLKNRKLRKEQTILIKNLLEDNSSIESSITSLIKTKIADQLPLMAEGIIKHDIEFYKKKS